MFKRFRQLANDVLKYGGNQPRRQERTPPYSNGYADWIPNITGEQIPGNDYGKALAVSASVWAGRAVQLRTHYVNRNPWELLNATGQVLVSSEDRTSQHPFSHALRAVRRQQKTGLFALWEQSRCITAETYLELTQNESFYRTGLNWLNPIGVDLQVVNGQIQAYRYNGGGASITFAPADIVYEIASKQPTDDLRGLSPMELALNSVRLDVSTMAQIQAQFKNQVRPGVLVSPKGDKPFSPAEADFIMKYMRENLKGSQNAGRASVMPVASEFTVLEYPSFEDHEYLQDRLIRQILVAFGVFRAMAGDLDNTQFKTNDEMEEWFYSATILPELQAIEDTLNFDVLPRMAWYQGEMFKFDTSVYDKVTEADQLVQDLNEQRYKSGVIDFFTFAELSDNPVGEEFKGWRWNEKAAAPMPPDKWKIGWQFGLVAGSVYNSELFTGEPLPQPVDPTLVTPTDTGSESLAPDGTPMVAGQPAPGINPALPVAPLDPTKDLGEPLFVGLSLANNADLIDLQRRVMTLHNDPAIQWNKPEDYHATLLYAPAVDAETAKLFCEALQELALPELSLRIGQLNTFDNVGEYALHFRIRSNTTLKEYQSSVYDLASEYGIQCSQYSDPAGYTPHITLGYLPAAAPRLTFDGKVKVTPRGVWCDYGEDTLWQSWVTDTPPDDPTPDDAEPDAEDTPPTKAALPEFDNLINPDQLAEWVAWRKFIKQRSSKSNVRDFIFKVTPDCVATYANTVIKCGLGLEAITSAVHEHYAGIATAKALTTTESRFKPEAKRQLTRAVEDKLKKPQFRQQFLATLELYGEHITDDVIEDLGIVLDLSDTDDDEVKAIRTIQREWKADQKTYIAGLSDKLYQKDDALTLDEVEDKPDLWWRGSLMVLYQKIMMAIGGNVRLIWRYAAGAEHCESCPVLNGIVLTAKDWDTEGVYPGSPELQCGIGCKCTREVTKAKKWRGKLPQWRFAKSIEMHDHHHETLEQE